MRRLLHPALWLPVVLLLLWHYGAPLLGLPGSTKLDERERGSYGYMPQWRMRFDALSAVCGAGLLTYNLDETHGQQGHYTGQGRWVLLGLGVAGALAYLTAARQAAGRLWRATDKPLPPIWAILIAYVTAQLLAIALAAGLTRISGAQTTPADTAWNAISAFSSLGWVREPPGVSHGFIYAAVALLGALGWPLWLLPWRRVLRRRAYVLAVGSYAAFLALCIAFFVVLEAPRAAPPGRAAGAPVPERQTSARITRGAIQVVAASGAGIPTERLDARGVSEGTKLLLATVQLVGGLGGSPGGGVKWTLALWALAGAAATVNLGRARSRDETARRAMLVGVVCLGALAAFTIIVALGLLVIEGYIGSPYQAPPTLADALVDASSAVAGGNLSSGLTATLTSANLSRGIRQSVDLYQYGMTWLMLAMFIGRVLPVLVLARLANLRFNDAPARLPPLI